MSRILIAMLSLITIAPLGTGHAAVVSGTITGGTVNGSGSVVILDPTMSSFAVGQNDFDTNNLYIFNEQQNVTLLADLVLDLGTTIAAGTVVSSHMVVFDPLDLQTVKGTLLFDQEILGIARRDSTLLATHFLGMPSVTYHSPFSFGLEPGDDYLTVGVPSPDALKINLLSASVPGDVFRVITRSAMVSSVPEPSTWASMIAGLLSCGAMMRTARRRRPAIASC